MNTIPVIIDNDIEPEEDTLGLLSAESGEPRIKNLKIDTLRESLSHLSESAAGIFQDIKQVGEFRLKEIELQVEITAEGGFALVGMAKAGAKGAIKLTFKE